MEKTLDESIMPVKEQVTWQELTERASRGDREAAAELIPMLDSNPVLVDRWGDLSRVALNLWMNIAGGEELSKAARHKHVLDLVRSVSRFENDPLEATMAKRIGILWLQVSYFDSQVALAADRTPAEQKLVAKRQKESQQLYADAAKALREYQDRQAGAQLAIFNGPPTAKQPR